MLVSRKKKIIQLNFTLLISIVAEQKHSGNLFHLCTYWPKSSCANFSDSQHILDEKFINSWLKGKCEDLVDLNNMTDSYPCELCFMHQYGLHRILDNLTDMCTGKKPVPTTGIVRCYWAPFPKPSKFVEKHDVKDPLIDLDIYNGPFCPPPDLNLINLAGRHATGKKSDSISMKFKDGNNKLLNYLLYISIVITVCHVHFKIILNN